MPLMVKKLTIIGLFVFASSSVFAATYYISPAGSDSGSGTSGSPFRTVSHAFSVGSGGDTYILKSGTYNYPGSELNSVIKSGGPGAYTVIKAETDGGAVLTQSGGLNLP